MNNIMFIQEHAEYVKHKRYDALAWATLGCSVGITIGAFLVMYCLK